MHLSRKLPLLFAVLILSFFGHVSCCFVSVDIIVQVVFCGQDLGIDFVFFVMVGLEECFLKSIEILFSVSCFEEKKKYKLETKSLHPYFLNQSSIHICAYHIRLLVS